ncbi:sugar-binding protein [uncultured Thiothrix sp.]|uniref:sugar-binding protein n=1 Tax=uncultured Thiothrix sp. TaxID=223185 RepID=UPI0026212F61|nr:sugar-binding protein [uncultured Thiothrix sp.]HMT94817.1 sugar-binding protein [Thiolinea sp.]
MITRFFRENRLIAAALLILLQLPTSAVQAYYNANSPLGTNTNEVLEYDSSAPFLDLFKTSLPFREAAPFLTKGSVQYDRFGWPTSIAPGAQAGTRLINKLPANTIPRGYYTVLYEGQGKIEYGLDASLVEAQPGRDVILIDPGKDNEYSVKLEIKATNPDNYIRNIHVIPQGGICASNPFQRVNGASQCARGDFLDFERNHEKIIFNPDYLKFMKDYKVVRFMNMSGITRNPIQRWADRSLVEQATWGGAEGVRGAPLEVMVELANRLHADPWFTIPHAADNDFVRRFAEYVRANLDPDLKIYIEYSNETWNGIFSQHAYMKQGGKQLNLDPVDYVAGYKFYSLRSVEIFNIFEQVFGGKQRLVRLMAGLNGNPGMTATMLSFRDAYKQTDAYAVAPYVFGDINELRRASSVNDIFRAMTNKNANHSLPKVLEAVRKQADVTRQFGVDLIAYEGGQHLIDDKTKSDDQHPNKLFYAANRSPEMAKIYKQLLDGWKQAGGKLFVHFSSPRTYNRFGSKGTKEYITQPDKEAPKYLALTQFISANPCWWPSCSSSTVARIQKPRALSTAELSRLTGDMPTALPNSQEEKAETDIAGNIPQIDPVSEPSKPTSPISNPPITRAPELPNIPPMRSQPVLVSMNNPPQEKYVFGNKAAIPQARDPLKPMANASAYQLRKVIAGQVENSRDLAAIWQASWDTKRLYLRIAVADDQMKLDSPQVWDDDSLEIFLDGDASQLRHYDGRDDLHIFYRWRDREITFGKNSARAKVDYRSQYIDGRYVLDLAVDWDSIQISPRPGHRIGLELQVNDDDNGGMRDGKLGWFSRVEEVWRDPSLMGEAVLE